MKDGGGEEARRKKGEGKEKGGGEEEGGEGGGGRERQRDREGVRKSRGKRALSNYIRPVERAAAAWHILTAH